MYPQRVVDYRKGSNRMTATNTNDFRIVLLKEKTHSLLLVSKFKGELLQSLERLNSNAILAIETDLTSIEEFISQQYKEIEDRAEKVGLN